jgi:propanediol dehydratase small subunit
MHPHTNGNTNLPAKPAHPTYPLAESAAESLAAANGRPLSAVTLDAAAQGALSAADIRISAATLRAQADIARQAGYTALAQNLERAAELTAVPDAELLRMYEQLRPGRAREAELIALAQQLERDFNAPITAAFVREATAVYRRRNLLRRD